MQVVWGTMDNALKQAIFNPAGTVEGALKEAQEKVIKIHEDIVDLKGIRRHFKEEMKRMVESHMKMIEFDKEREEDEGGGMKGE